MREQKTDESIYRYNYQAQFAERDLETSWNHFELREFDPVIGRWMVMDPLRQYWSPYNGMGNDPVNHIDPTGGEGGPARPKQGTPSFKYGNIEENIYGARLPSVTVDPSSLNILDFFGQSSMPIPNGTFTGATSDRQNFFESVPVYTSEVGELKNRAAGTLPGVGIFVNAVDVNNIDLLRHEFGHILQARIWGNKFYYSEVVPASLRSANKANNNRSFNHDYTWTEWTANYFSYKYFNSPSDWDKAHPYSLPSGYSRSGIYPPIGIFKFYSINTPKKP